MRKFVNFSFIISIISISSFGQIISEKSNIIFFLVDDLGWTDLSCYGSSFYETPNIDKLAERVSNLQMHTQHVAFVLHREQVF